MSYMKNIEGTDFTFPIGSGIVDGQGFDLKNISGTAFSISEDTFITAGHVFQNMQSNNFKDFMIGKYDKKENWGAAKILEYEINEKYDLAVFKANVPNVKRYRWSSAAAKLGTDIMTFGYPFALDTSNIRIDFRLFKGYVVGKRPLGWGLPYLLESYELSFMCPRGLSGSFILNSTEEKICGIVIGNSGIEIEIYHEIEEVSDCGKAREFRKTETMKLGIGLTSPAILEAYFGLLGSTLKNHLEKNSLL